MFPGIRNPAYVSNDDELAQANENVENIMQATNIRNQDKTMPIHERYYIYIEREARSRRQF
jgi:hypothetical protein